MPRRGDWRPSMVPLLGVLGLFSCGGMSAEPEWTATGATGGASTNSGGAEPGEGGTGGEAPADGGAESAGSGASGQAPRGASAVSPSDVRCGIGPYTIPVLGMPTSDQVVGDRVIDGEAAEVDCSIVADGDGYRITVALARGSSTFWLAATIAPEGDGYVGTGSVEFYDPHSGKITSQTCTVDVLPTQQVGPGKAWGNFDCTDSLQEGSPGASCDFGGSFIAENCK